MSISVGQAQEIATRWVNVFASLPDPSANLDWKRITANPLLDIIWLRKLLNVIAFEVTEDLAINIDSFTWRQHVDTIVKNNNGIEPFPSFVSFVEATL